MCPVECIAMNMCYCVNVSCEQYSNECVLLCPMNSMHVHVGMVSTCIALRNHIMQIHVLNVFCIE